MADININGVNTDIQNVVFNGNSNINTIIIDGTKVWEKVGWKTIWEGNLIDYTGTDYQFGISGFLCARQTQYTTSKGVFTSGSCNYDSGDFVFYEEGYDLFFWSNINMEVTKIEQYF